jgi:hypothetical protein
VWWAEATGGGGEASSSGCSYLFHDAEGFLSFTGHWEGDRLVWDTAETQKGPWSPEQEAGGHSSSHLVADDGTVRPDPEWKPPTAEEGAGPLATAPSGGRDGAVAPSSSGPRGDPYPPLEPLEIRGAVEEMPAGCAPRDVAGLFDHFFAAFNAGDAAALERFVGSDFQYYVHPRNYVEQPRSRDALVPFLLERRADEERMLLLAVRVDAVAAEPAAVEVDLALAFHTPTTAAPHWLGALVNCHDQTLVNVGYRSYDLDLIPGEILAHASCPPLGKPAVADHHVACARVKDVDERLAL